MLCCHDYRELTAAFFATLLFCFHVQLCPKLDQQCHLTCQICTVESVTESYIMCMFVSCFTNFNKICSLCFLKYTNATVQVDRKQQGVEGWVLEGGDPSSLRVGSAENVLEFLSKKCRVLCKCIFIAKIYTWPETGSGC